MKLCRCKFLFVYLFVYFCLFFLDKKLHNPMLTSHEVWWDALHEKREAVTVKKWTYARAYFCLFICFVYSFLAKNSITKCLPHMRSDGMHCMKEGKHFFSKRETIPVHLFICLFCLFILEQKLHNRTLTSHEVWCIPWKKRSRHCQKVELLYWC